MSPARDYLVVDQYLRTAVDCRALGTAFEVGLIDYLLADREETAEGIGTRLGLESVPLQMLLGLLAANRVVQVSGDRFGLAEPFREALRFRDVLQAKIDFANLVGPDFLDHFTSLLTDPQRFMDRARLFRLFDYNRCLDDDPANREATRRWVRFTSALTRYEAKVCLEEHDFTSYRQMMDIGGNSGEFALQLCKAQPQLQATVVDLPVVCRIGREHVGAEPESQRITFVEANALADRLPTGFDLVTFKSILHDWPEAETIRFLSRAVGSLRPGGTLLIFERERIAIGPESPPFSMVPMLLFFRYFRSPEFYASLLSELGLLDVSIRRFALEMPFFVVAARAAS